MTDVIDKKGEGHSRRKPIWPWLFLLALTLLTIHTWDRATDLFEDFSRNMPTVVIELFQDLLNQSQRDGKSVGTMDIDV